MYNVVQVKEESTAVEDVNQNARASILNNAKYPVYTTQDAFKYRQYSQFWDQNPLVNDVSLKGDIYAPHNMPQIDESRSLQCPKDHIPHGVLFQLDQHSEEVTTQPQLNTDQYRRDVPTTPNIRQSSNTPDQTLQIASSPTSTKQNRPGRPPKGSGDTNPGKKIKSQCEICFKEFGHKSNLFIHMRTHNGERPYKCSQCDKCFTHSGNLAIHLRTHSGERPFGCQVCGKTFSHSGNLSTHLRTHSGVKPYKCNICSKEFRHSGNLSIHERIHSGIKPFQCKICGKEFYHSGNLTTHMKKHPVQKNNENNERQVICNDTVNNYTLNNIGIVPTSSNNSLSIHGLNNEVPVKNERNEENMLHPSSLLASSTS